MHRIAGGEISAGLAGPRRLLSQVGFGIVCAVGMIAVRWVVDQLAPGSGPFALVYPAIMLATLYGRLPAGVVTFVLTLAWAWWAVLPVAYSFAFNNPDDFSRLIVNAASALIIVFFAEAFRRAVEVATRQRDEEIVRRDQLIAEIRHRTKNNFAMVAALLSIQRRKHSNPELRQALDDASLRIGNFAQIYDHLHDDRPDQALVDMAPYLDGLIDTLAGAGFDGDNVRIERAIDDLVLPKDRAVAVGVVLNEALTNVAKYAFPDDRQGLVRVEFGPSGKARTWRLVVEDDGIGSGAKPAKVKGSGLGSDLMDTFAQQAEAEIRNEPVPQGTRVVMEGPYTNG